MMDIVDVLVEKAKELEKYTDKRYKLVIGRMKRNKEDYEINEDEEILLDSMCLKRMGETPKNVLETCECFKEIE